MQFNSIHFFLFLPAVLVLYTMLRHRGQNRMLLAASYLFYGWWDERFLFLIALSTVVDYWCGLLIGRGGLAGRKRAATSAYLAAAALCFITINWSAFRIGGAEGFGVDWAALVNKGLGVWVLLGTLGLVAVANLLYPLGARLDEDRRRKLGLWTSVVINLTILGVFKYFNFFIDSAEEVINHLGMDARILHLNIVLPVGISFYTFQTMCYTIDVYRRKLPPTDRFLDFALYVAYFPQLVAGPIERPAALLPRIMNPRRFDFCQLQRGCFLILLGLFKKVGIADGVAASVDSIYGTTGVISAGDILVATLLFVIQIYCDFSGYSDIARGVSKLLGIDLMTNFRVPFFSRSPREFWQRWHISLSSWLRDYLYIPLGGNRKGATRTYINLSLVMLLGGLWHGAAWNFVLWGGFNAIVLIIYANLGKRGLLPEVDRPDPLWRRVASIALFFAITCYGFLLFRAGSMTQIVEFTQTLATGAGGLSWSIKTPSLAAVLGIPFLFAYELFEYRSDDAQFYRKLPAWSRGGLYASMIIAIVLGTGIEPTEFIYFQF